MMYTHRTAEQLTELKSQYISQSKTKVQRAIKPHEIAKLSKKGLAFFLHKKANCIEDYRTLKQYSKANLVALALKLNYR